MTPAHNHPARSSALTLTHPRHLAPVCRSVVTNTLAVVSSPHLPLTPSPLPPTHTHSTRTYFWRRCLQLCNILIDGISTLTRWEHMLENGKAAEVEKEIAAKLA